MIAIHRIVALACVWVALGDTSLHAQGAFSSRQSTTTRPVKTDQVKTYSEAADSGLDGGKIYLNDRDYMLITGSFNYYGGTADANRGRSLTITLYPPLEDKSYRAINCGISATTLPNTSNVKTAEGLFRNYMEMYSPENRANDPLNSYNTVEPSEKDGLFTIKSIGRRGPARTIRYNYFFNRGDKVWNISYFCVSRSGLDVETLTNSRIVAKIAR